MLNYIIIMVNKTYSYWYRISCRFTIF